MFLLPYSHPPKYSDRRLPPIRPTDRRIPTDLGNLSNSNSPRVRFNLKPIHFPVEIDDFPATRFRERSPSDPLVSFGSFLTDQRRVRFRSSSIESNDNVLLTIDDERQEARTSSGLGFEAGVGLGLGVGIRHTCSKSGSVQDPDLLQDFNSNPEKTPENSFGAKKMNRKQFRSPDDRGSKGRTLPRVQTLPSGGFYRLQRPCDDVVSCHVYTLRKILQETFFCWHRDLNP